MIVFLPRKFKVAFTGTKEDRALIQVHDLAFEAISNEPEAIFRVRAGGGLGRIPVLGPVIREKLNWKDIRSYTHALMRVYNELGRRDNLTKARIKILIRTIGIDNFKTMVEAEFKNLKNSADKLSDDDLEKIKTIGDAYMVAGGRPRKQPGHAAATLAATRRPCAAELAAGPAGVPQGEPTDADPTPASGVGVGVE